MDFQKAFVFLFLGVLGLAASAADECIKAFKGGSYTIALGSPKQEGDSLVWIHNKIVVYQRRRTKITGGVVDDNGSLLLNNLTSAMSGTYKAEHHDREGTLIKTITEKLCVIPKAPVPTLALTCPSSGVPALQCHPKNIPGFTLSWLHNNKEMAGKNPLQPKQRGEKELYTCRLSNDQYRDDKEDSKPVAASCSVPVLSRAVRLVLAGAVILIVILTLALVIVSCKYCPQRNRKRVHEHARLSSLRDTRADPPQWKPSPPGDQGYSHTPQEDPSPAASQPGDQPPPQPPPAAAAATATEKPPHTPVPQPRKKLNLIPKANDSNTSANGQDCV
ncbi:hypothetical protein ACEWY4_017007 [Coilia grayii]|uniref:Ig-like domain-containing protein n=1 Tax=Coilia grayii TaxID=363190 RepID=A0ABD1JMY8_9TELE